MDDLVEVELARLVVQTGDDHQYVHLRTKEDNRTFPIVIGFVEANELRRKILSESGERPMTHDLIGRVLDATGWTLKRVAINGLHDGTFYAMLALEHEDDEKLVDCRPSDRALPRRPARRSDLRRPPRPGRSCGGRLTAPH